MKTLLTCLAVSLVGATLSADDASGPKPGELFKQFDKNNDGTLEASEIGEEQKRFFDRLVRVGDKNDDGKLSEEEYSAAMNAPERRAAVESGGRPGAGRGPGRMAFNPEQIFERFDENKDGKISRDEVPEDSRMRGIFARLGKDEVTKEDFVRMAPGRGGSGQGRGGEMAARLKEFDKNEDGKLSVDEAPEQMKQRLRSVLDRTGGNAVPIERLLAYGGAQREGDRPRSEARERDGDRPRPEGREREGDRPRPEGDRPPRDGDRPPRDGDRPPREGDRPRPEGDRPPRDGEMRRGPRDGEGPPRGRMGEGPAFLRAWDKNEDGQLSREELATAVLSFDRLDRNKDGQLDRGELFGFGGRPGMEGREGFRARPGMREGDRPGRPPFERDGDRPRPEERERDRPDRERPERDRPERDNAA